MTTIIEIYGDQETTYGFDLLSNNEDDDYYPEEYKEQDNTNETREVEKIGEVNNEEERMNEDPENTQGDRGNNVEVIPQVPREVNMESLTHDVNIYGEPNVLDDADQEIGRDSSIDDFVENDGGDLKVIVENGPGKPIKPSKIFLMCLVPLAMIYLVVLFVLISIH